MSSVTFLISLEFIIWFNGLMGFHYGLKFGYRRSVEVDSSIGAAIFLTINASFVGAPVVVVVDNDVGVGVVFWCYCYFYCSCCW